MGRVFNSRLGCLAVPRGECLAYIEPLLELKTWPRFSPSNLSLSMVILSYKGRYSHNKLHSYIQNNLAYRAHSLVTKKIISS
jgi:hypothetical protein